MKSDLSQVWFCDPNALEWASWVAFVVKNPPANAGDIRDAGSTPGSGRFPWRRPWQPIPVLLPGESHGQRSLAGYRVGHCWSNWACMHAMHVNSPVAFSPWLWEKWPLLSPHVQGQPRNLGGSQNQAGDITRWMRPSDKAICDIPKTFPGQKKRLGL